ncbi:MAG: hypothetical protein AAFX50_11395 [Acidobacteriota bacterium]
MHNVESTFVEFRERAAVLRRLRSIDVYETGMEPMFQLVAERLAETAYDRSAFVFILLELIYEFEQDSITFSDMLGRLVFALTEDLDLVGEALEAFDEIQRTLAPAPAAVAVAAEPAVEATRATSSPSAAATADVEGGGAPMEELWDADPDHEHLMLELQTTQKRVLDFGLATRVSIEMALARPSRDNVQQTLRDVSELRQSLLHFEELLRESEQRILEAIGVLDRA